MSVAKKRGRPNAIELNTWCLVRKFEGGLVEFENMAGRRMRIQFHNCEWCHQACAEGKVISFKQQMICGDCYAQKIERRAPLPDAEVFGLELKDRSSIPTDLRGRRRRELRELRATPPWADKKAIAERYAAARRVSKKMGVLYEVDHFYPLACAVASGLHVAENLMVIRADKNRWKSNKFPLDNSPVWNGMTSEEVNAEMTEMVSEYRAKKRNMRLAKAVGRTRG